MAAGGKVSPPNFEFRVLPLSTPSRLGGLEKRQPKSRRAHPKNVESLSVPLDRADHRRVPTWRIRLHPARP
jgi:hypothetical protein